AAIEARLGATVEVRRVLVRDLHRARDVDVPPELLTTDAGAILRDPEIDVIVELIGGIEPARAYILDALAAGKHVVTANKAVLAERGAEIFAAADAGGLGVFFEGSVAGGIPLLRSLREGLASDRIDGLAGIVNGTANFILDAMTRRGLAYADALRMAQEAGYAEADPTLDVSGGDAAHKLALLALVAFGRRVDPAAIPTEGIEEITALDIRAADDLGYVIKSLALGDRGPSDDGGDPCLRVHPVLVPKGHVLAGVHGPYNACLVRSQGLGRSLYYGRGAGMMPTGVAVLSDIIEVARLILATPAGGALPPAARVQARPAAAASVADLRHENYLCVLAPNRPGVLGRVAACLGAHDVSIKYMHQDEPPGADLVPLIMLTEPAREADIDAALAELRASPELPRPPRRLRVLAVEAADDA
ncbi:MAG: homoserine dehydrogenase, partial [Myxococcales bacterium]|nr:homoserine dehydrogenase [Myxococcales bacterium]